MKVKKWWGHSFVALVIFRTAASTAVKGRVSGSYSSFRIHTPKRKSPSSDSVGTPGHTLTVRQKRKRKEILPSLHTTLWDINLCVSYRSVDNSICISGSEFAWSHWRMVDRAQGSSAGHRNWSLSNGGGPIETAWLYPECLCRINSTIITIFILLFLLDASQTTQIFRLCVLGIYVCHYVSFEKNLKPMLAGT